MLFEGAGGAAAAAPAGARQAVGRPPPPAPVSAPGGIAEVRVPDIGDFKDIPVIEIFVKVGDTVKAEDPLLSLESDKATMDVPAPLGGTVERDPRQGRRQGHREGTAILMLATGAASGAPTAAASVAAAPRRVRSPRHPRPLRNAAAAAAGAGRRRHRRSGIRAGLCRARRAQAGARTGRRPGQGQGHRASNGRIVSDDVEAFAKGGGAAQPAAAAAAAAAPAGAAAAAASTCCRGRRSTSPSSDRSKRKALSRIKKISGAPTCTATGS